MAAAHTDLLQEVGVNTATTLDAPGYTIGDTSLTVASTANMPTATGITIAIDEVDANGDQVAGSYNEYVGVVASATSITNLSHQNGTNQNYTAGTTTRVYLPVSAERENRIVEWGTTEHNQDGTHDETLITSRTEDTSPDLDSDFLLSYDTSATALKKVKPSNLFGGGWANLEDTPDTVTYNGNRSYDLVFNTNDLTDTVSNGMRVKLTRTVTAPTGCLSLNGSSQYASKGAGTFTGLSTGTTWTFKAKLKLNSYKTQVITSFDDGSTNILQIYTNASGQIILAGGTYAATDTVTSYQSHPLNKWFEVTGSITIGTPTGEITMDGAMIPSYVSASAATTFTAGSTTFYVGRNAAGNYLDGEIAQVEVFNAIISASTLRSQSSQTITGSETNALAAYKLDQASGLNDLTTNANNLTASGSPSYATDTPFAGGATGTTEYGIITANAFSTNTTLTVQVPEGYAIPTTGGVSAVSYSTQDTPYGFPRDKGRWEVVSNYRTQTSTAFGGTGSWYAATGISMSVPVGSWRVGHAGSFILSSTVSGVRDGNWTLSATTPSGRTTDYGVGVYEASSSVAIGTVSIENTETLSVATSFFGYGYIASSTGSESFAIRGDSAGYKIYAIPAYL